MSVTAYIVNVLVIYCKKYLRGFHALLFQLKPLLVVTKYESVREGIACCYKNVRTWPALNFENGFAVNSVHCSLWDVHGLL